MADPIWKHWITQLTTATRLIRYDDSGNGLSDWEVKEMSLDLCVRDLETVVDSARVDRLPSWDLQAVRLRFPMRYATRNARAI